MLLAVNMPEHEPQVGQAERSISPSSASLTLASLDGDHRIDEVELADERLAVAVVRADELAGLHRAARDEDGRDVEPHRRHQHAGRDLVAVGDADQRVGAVRVHHVLDAVGDELAAGQRVQHPAVAHRDAVVDGDGVELDAPAAGGVDHLLHALADVVQVDVPGDELREAVGDGDDRLLEVGVGHARSRARASARPPCCGPASRCGCGIPVLMPLKLARQRDHSRSQPSPSLEKTGSGDRIGDIFRRYL